MKVIFCVVFVFVQFGLYAQQPILKFEQLGVEQNLKANFVESVFQDHLGYMWIATRDGLYKYNGYDCVLYKHDVKDSTSLLDNYIYRLEEDSQLRLWIGYSFGGMSIYNREKDCFENIAFADSSMSNKKFKNSLRDIFEDRQGNFWALNSFGVARLSTRDSVWRWYKQSIDSVSMVDRYSFGMCQVFNGSILLGFRDNGSLLIYDSITDGFRKFPLRPKDSSSEMGNSITILKQDFTGALWIGTVDAGLLKVDLADSTYVKYDASDNSSCGIMSNEIVDIYEDSKRNLWIGSVNGGLHLYNRESNVFYNYNTETANQSNLSSNTISKITEDTHGNLWFATHSGGVNVLNYQKNSIKHYGKSPISPSLNSNLVSCFLQTTDNELWIGTDGGGLHRLDLLTNKVDAYTKIDGLSSNVILDIVQGADNDLWLATWGGGVVKFNRKTHRVQNYLPHLGNSINFMNVKGLMYDDGRLWIATHGKGINILDTKNEVFYSDSSNYSGIDFDYTHPYWGNNVVKDQFENIWISTSLGLYRYHNSTTTEYFTEGQNFKQRSSLINVVYADSKGDVWVGMNGLCLYDRAHDSLVSMNAQYPELPNIVTTIEEDADGFLWLGSNNGVYKFSPTDGHVNNFTVEDGLQSNVITARASIKLRDGRIAIGTDKGFNIFNPRELTLPEYELPVLISSCSIWLSTDGAHTSTKRNILLTKQNEIPYEDSKIITIDYHGLSLNYAKKLNYSYKLEGFDDEWRVVDKMRQAVYTSLKPGAYRFLVRARMNEANWQTNASEYSFVILQPWYFALWFKIMVGAMCALIILLIIYQRTKTISKHNVLLASLVEQKTEELQASIVSLAQQREEVEAKNISLEESQDLIRIRNEELNQIILLKDRLLSVLAHDLRNYISSILSFSNILKTRFLDLSQAKQQEYVELIDTSATKLQAKFIDLLDWAQSHSVAVANKPQLLNLDVIIRDAVSLFDTAVIAKKIKLSVVSDCKCGVNADPRIVSAIYRNFIGNAVKFTAEEGEIKIVISENEDRVVCYVIDNGIGMEPETVQNLLNSVPVRSTDGTNMEKGSGYGLQMCFEFAKICNADLFINSVLGQGTEIGLSLPKAELLIVPSVKPNIFSRANGSKKMSSQTMLIAEDNYEMLKLLSELFQDQFIVEVANNGKEALAIASDLLPDIILSDIEMPELDGLSLCHELKNDRLTSHIPIILITGQSEVDQHIIGIESGANDYVVKPFNHEILKSKVLSVLANAQNIREHLKLQMLSTSLHTDIPESKDEQLLRQVADIVATHIRTPDLSVEFIADKVGMSRSHLYRKFKATLGYSPVEYIRIFRVKRAADLLRAGHMRISEVAYDVGFFDPKYFSSCFKREYGMNPSDFLQNEKLDTSS